MIPRAEIEFTLAMAQKGLRSETPPEVMAELCRVYLAWVDAPERVVTPAYVDGLEGYESFGYIQIGRLLIGKRLKLVEVE